MVHEYSMRVIARIHSDFSTKFGVPRQSGLVDALESLIVFEPEFRNADALRGLEGFGTVGPPRCARPVWVETSGWACSQPVPPSAPIPLPCLP